jgi:hypothetical protein
MPVPKMANNGFKSVLCSLLMDLFDERVLAVLSDGKPKFFARLLGEVGFSRNTLKLHLKRLDSSESGGEGKNALEWTRKAEIHLFPVAKGSAASFCCPVRPVDNDCHLAVQPPKAPVQVREGWILQTNQKQV